MQDAAPAHAAKGTIKDLQKREIVCLRWPIYSPDLNPIEIVWNWMKDWIQERYDDNLHRYNAPRAAIIAA
jgi:transposase